MKRKGGFGGLELEFRTVFPPDLVLGSPGCGFPSPTPPNSTKIGISLRFHGILGNSRISQEPEVGSRAGLPQAGSLE